MRSSIHGMYCVFLAGSIALFPLTSEAIFPAVMLGKDILQNVILGKVKDQMFGSLANMGCKGSHLAGLIASVNAKKGLMGGGAMPSGMSAGMFGGGVSAARSGGMNVPGMAMPNGMGSMPMAIGATGSQGGNYGLPTVSPEQAQAMMANGMPQAAFMSQMSGMSPDQAGQMQQAMAGMQEAMSHPLSRTETVAVFDEMAGLGLMTNEMRGEVHDCIELAPTGSDSSIGMTGAMIKTMILPKLRDAKQRLSALTPEEQSQLTDGMVDALQHASAKDRQNFLDGFGAGFYPAPVVEKVRARMAGK